MNKSIYFLKKLNKSYWHNIVNLSGKSMFTSSHTVKMTGSDMAFDVYDI